MRHLLNNKDANIVVNESHCPIPQVQDKKKRYTSRDVKLADHERQFQNINRQPIKRILHAVNNNILKNLPILREDVRMAEGIYGPSLTHLKGNTVWSKIQHVEPVKLTSFTKNIIDKYKEVTICCDCMHIN